MGRQLSFNEEIVTDSGVFFAGVSLPPSPTPCIGAGIWTPITNLNDGDLLGCPDNGNNAINGVNGDGCNLLVVLEDESQLNDTSNIKIDDCRQGGSIISLQLVPPQPVLSYSFWDNENGEGSLFTWQNENGASNTVNIPVSGNNNGVTEDISTNQQLPPNDVQFVNVTYGGSGGLQTLRLCSTTTTTPMVNEPPPTTTGAVVEGDPHIHTFEGEHYLLLNQGTFDLWHLSGLQTSFVSNVSLGLTKKVDVNWQVYTHYSGSKSFTKAILVVDKSGGHLRQMAELTSKDCQWRIRMPGKEWEVVKESKLFFVPDGLPDGKKDYVTGFKVGLENQHLKMSMNTEQGKTNIAGIYTTCRPAHFLNLKLHMMRTNSGDEKFVKGEMRGFQRVKPISGKRPVGLTPATASALQLDTEMQSTDEEFSVKRRWQELGGSELTAEYLEAVDEKGPISHFLGTCDEEAKREAHAICAKHLGAAMAKGPEAAFFNDCVTDVCNGAGEVAAELAAELRVSSRRKDKD